MFGKAMFAGAALGGALCTGALFVGTVPGGPTAAASALPISPKTHSHSRISDMGKSLSFDNMAKSGTRTSCPLALQPGESSPEETP